MDNILKNASDLNSYFVFNDRTFLSVSCGLISIGVLKSIYMKQINSQEKSVN